MTVCIKHNHNYPHQVDGEEACPKCEAEKQIHVENAERLEVEIIEEEAREHPLTSNRKKSDKI